MQNFESSVALVTGAGSGIGKAVATKLAAAGAHVVVTDINDSAITTADALKQAGHSASGSLLDVRDGEQIKALVASIAGDYGKLDIAVNNAGIDPEVAPEASWEEAILDQVLAINLKGVFLCMKHEIAQMLEQGGGRIVNTASSAGLRGFANKPAYTASKHGVVGLTRAAAVQYAGRGIRINAVCPGAVDTAMLENNLGDEKGREMVAANHPIQRVATADEIADAVVWLCGDTASFVTGHALAVDGGLTV